MVVLTGPMLSFDASGSLAGILCFGRNHGRRSARMIPRTSPAASSPSTAQTQQRDAYRNGVTEWNLFTDSQRLPWTHAGDHCRPPITGYNLWLSWWLTHDVPRIRTLQRFPDVGTLYGGPDDPLPARARLYPRWLAFARPSVANPNP